MAALRFSIRFTTTRKRDSVERIVRNARLAEKSGFYALWVSKDLFKRSSWVILSAVAANTRKIQLGTDVVNPYTENPAELVMASATLDEFSGGRFLLGIGAGSHRWISIVGIDQKRPLTAAKETVKIVRTLMTGGTADQQWTVFGKWSPQAYLRFRPLRADIPIYIGGRGPKMCQAMGELADGGLPVLTPPEYIESVMKNVAEGARKAGRKPLNIDIAACVWGVISKREDKAMEIAKEEIVKYSPILYPDALKTIGLQVSDFAQVTTNLEMPHRNNVDNAKSFVTDKMLKLGIVGTSEDWIRRLESLAEKGLNHPAIWLTQPDIETGIRILAKEVMPYFQQSNKGSPNTQRYLKEETNSKRIL